MVASGPSYNAMATAAILAMKDRTGSSVMAITKWVQTEYPNLAFKKHLLGAALKKGAASGAFVKVKASYKVSMNEKKKIAAAAKPKKAKAKKVVKKKATKKKATKKKPATKKKKATKKKASSKKK